ncbi:ABC transporter ATP-binding protein [Capilliphycus salinus ALCB114379]|uniref:ABC transporter ATP-binding protein n=1 Tax=Capilliphycus salinus TaxID=2768948 RepID=UPI0039A59430
MKRKEWELLWSFIRPYRVWMGLSLTLGLIDGLLGGIGLTLVVPVAMEFLGLRLAPEEFPSILNPVLTVFENVPTSLHLPLLAIVTVGAIVLQSGVSYLNVLVSGHLTRRLITHLRDAELQLLLAVDIAFYTHRQLGDLKHILETETQRAVSSIRNLLRIAILSITITVFVGILILLSWRLTLITSLFLLGVVKINQMAIAQSRNYGKKISNLSKDYAVSLLELLSGIRLVKTTANEPREYGRLQRLMLDCETADFAAQAMTEAIAPLGQLLGVFGVLLLVFAAHFLGLNTPQGSALILTYIVVLFRLLPQLSALDTYRSRLAHRSASVEIVQNFLRRDNKPFMVNGSLPYSRLEKEIRFNNVSFSYPKLSETEKDSFDESKPILTEINLSIPQGSTLAVVGTSGAGKSTLADLLCRLYDPDRGTITLDGEDLRNFDLSALRSAIAVVSQDVFLFNKTIRYNLTYASNYTTETEIWEGVKQAYAEEFITQLPEQLDTRIGDRGIRLSGGQRQRLAIARALLQKPDILILDEATSALDSLSEQQVQQAFNRLSCTRFIIAHRLSTIQNADQIAVLKEGKIVECGTHSQLILKQGYYSHFYQEQTDTNQ